MSGMAKSFSKKYYFQLEGIEPLYKLIYKYNLRETAYKQLLQFYIQFQKAKNDDQGEVKSSRLNK